MGGQRSLSRARRGDAPTIMASAWAGLSEREQKGCQELLELLHTDDLIALTDTVTNRLVQPDSRQGGAAGSKGSRIPGLGSHLRGEGREAPAAAAVFGLGSLRSSSTKIDLESLRCDTR